MQSLFATKVCVLILFTALVSACNYTPDQLLKEAGLKSGAKMGGMLIQNERNKATQTFVTTALAVDASKNSITLTLTPTDGVTPKIEMSDYGDRGAMMVKFANRPESEVHYSDRSGCFEDEETD